ncbi:hypothetical protein QZH41_003760 [Actinostola sp. cb2023]|nr:hypothetical protein QZH41_003760 [Actinostola sp. cb2023]
MGCGSSKDVQPTTNRSKVTANALNTDNNNVVVHKDTLVLDAENIVKEKRYKIGDRVHVRGYVGTVKFLGHTKLGEGEWIGIELDKPHAQGNNGAFEETKYFSCKPKHGLIVRPQAVSLHKEEIVEGVTFSKSCPETIVFIQNKMRQLLEKIRLRKLQERSGNEKLIDKHVMNTPAEEEESSNRLSVYLTEPFTSDRDKAYAIYKWLTLNIAYDVDGFFGRDSKKSCQAEDVLTSKLSVCAGYANLFEAMGKAAGLDIQVISGYAKGYGHQPGQRIQGTNHAWNALRIDDQWYLSDATWGAGNVGYDMMFHRDTNTYRFLMDPEYAIFDHLPEDEKWQLLDEPVSKETFGGAAVMSGPMYCMGVEFLSHKDQHYDIDSDSMEITFYCPGKKMILMSKVKDSSGQALSGLERTQIRPCGINQVKMRAQFPSPGTYTIDIYVNVEGSWTSGTSYTITTTKGFGEDKGGFPQISGSFYDGFDLISPLENIETNSGKAEIKLECYSRRFSSVFGNVLGVNESGKNIVKNQALCFLEVTNAGFLLKVDTPGPGTYMLNIFAKEDNKNHFLCKYYITNTEKDTRDVTGFPRLTDDFHAWGLELVEPRENIVTSDGRATIKIKAAQSISTISLNCNLQPDSGTNIHLQPNQQLCFYEKSNDMLIVKIDAPRAGMYTLNIFGARDGEESKQIESCETNDEVHDDLKGVRFALDEGDDVTWHLTAQAEEETLPLFSSRTFAIIGEKVVTVPKFSLLDALDEGYFSDLSITASNGEKAVHIRELKVLKIIQEETASFLSFLFQRREDFCALDTDEKVRSMMKGMNKMVERELPDMIDNVEKVPHNYTRLKFKEWKSFFKVGTAQLSWLLETVKRNKATLRPISNFIQQHEPLKILMKELGILEPSPSSKEGPPVPPHKPEYLVGSRTPTYRVNHSASLSRAAAALLDSGKYTDMTFIVSGYSTKQGECQLCMMRETGDENVSDNTTRQACSESKNGNQACTCKDISRKILVPDTSPFVFRKFLESLYLETIDTKPMTTDQLVEMMTLTDIYEDDCFMYIASNKDVLDSEEIDKLTNELQQELQTRMQNVLRDVFVQNNQQMLIDKQLEEYGVSTMSVQLKYGLNFV